ncbi:hypothetical protein B0H13DRAFT_1937004 [Mycena leptocephala]|nr:hypothetical protein B0H13DRAFT_1937004 [Mycena leptocephala]
MSTFAAYGFLRVPPFLFASSPYLSCLKPSVAVATLGKHRTDHDSWRRHFCHNLCHGIFLPQEVIYLLRRHELPVSFYDAPKLCEVRIPTHAIIVQIQLL